MAFKPIDISNQRYHELTAIKFVEKRKLGKHFYHFWEFKCDCGNTKVINKSTVTTGSVKSCGCLHLKNIFKKESGQANFTHAFHYYKASAKKRGLIFDLTKNEFKNLTQLNCYYCKAAPQNKMNDKHCNGAFIYNGVDRLNNKLGYSMVNCVACCKTCNIAKRDLSMSEFIQWIKTVYENHFFWSTNNGK